MKKGLLLGVTVLAAIGIGVGIYMYKKDNKLSDSDFDAIVGLSKNKGYDIFDAPADKLANARKKYLSGFNRRTHNELMSILEKGEKNMSAIEKSKLMDILKKLK